MELMALESSSMILYIAKISCQSDNWFGNRFGEIKVLHTHTHTHTDTHTHTHTHTHTEAYFIGLVFLQKCRNKSKQEDPLRS